MARGDIVEDRIVRVKLSAIEKPRRGHCEVMVNSWWVFDPESESVIFYQRHDKRYSSAQCHDREGIAKKVFGQVWEPFGFELRQVPVAFVPIWMHGEVDFGYNLKPLLQAENVLEEL